MASAIIYSTLLAVGLCVPMAVIAFCRVDGGKSGNEPLAFPDATESASVRFLSNFLPPLSISICLLCFVVFPYTIPGTSWVRELPIWLHWFGFSLLFVFVVMGQYLQIEAGIREIRKSSIESIVKTYSLLSNITKLLPAPAALTILLSGLTLIYHSGYSISVGWLFILVGIFSFLFIDGLTYYLPRTERLLDLSRKCVKARSKKGQLREEMSSILDNIFMFIHYVSLPFVFLLGYFKPQLPNPMTGMIRELEDLISSIPSVADFSHVIPAMIWIIMIVAIVSSLRLWSLNRRSATYLPNAII